MFRSLLAYRLYKYIGVFSFARLVAQAAPSSGDVWVDTLLKGGPFAIVLLLIILDKIGTHGERDRLRVENAELRLELKNLNEDIRKDILPPLSVIASGLPEFNKVLERTTVVLERHEESQRRGGKPS